MIDLIKQVIDNPSLSSVLILLLIGAFYVIWQIVSRRLNLSNQSYDEVVNERAKELINNLSNRVNVLEITVTKLQTELTQEKEENLRLAMLNALILSSKTMIKGVPHWVFGYPDHKAIFISKEYSIFLKNGVTISDYINEYNSKIWNSEIAKNYNKNNEKAAKKGFWFGFEEIIVDGVDMTYDFIIVKVALRDNYGKVDKVFGMALEIKSNKAKVYLKQLIELTKIPE